MKLTRLKAKKRKLILISALALVVVAAISTTITLLLLSRIDYSIDVLFHALQKYRGIDLSD